MNNDKKTDAFTYHVMGSISSETLNSLSPSQISAIKDAIMASKPKEKHPVDFRGVINFYFAKYYFVFLMGRDRRITTLNSEVERRENVALLGNISFLFFVIAPFILLFLIILYLLKVFLGIDLFPAEHMGWILGL